MKKKIALISFTGKGAETAKHLAAVLEETCCCSVYTLGKASAHSEGSCETPRESASQWTKKRFKDSDGLIFVGAVGIAVRLIAPYIKDKMEDPAVVSVDEQGKYAVPILSGHMGGANRLAREIAKALGAIAVITTATDLNRKFAVDVFARENGLVIGNRELAKSISARILNGERVTIYSDLSVRGGFPPELQQLSEEDREKNILPDIWITEKRMDGHQNEILFLIPRRVTLGMGCRKGAGKDAILNTAEKLCLQAGIDKRSIGTIASIDLKCEEEGLAEAARELNAGLVFFSAKELAEVPGCFSESEFVKKVTGVGNVCERAALLGAGGNKRARLIAGKLSFEGVTAAAAVTEQWIEAGRKTWEES